LEDIERNVRVMIKEASEEINNLSRKLENLASDQSNLDLKIEKKKSDLERNQNRFKSMMSVRPAFMDEYEKLEKDLQKLYYIYVDRIRNLEYLETELETYNRSEQEKNDQAQKHLRKAQNKAKGKLEIEEDEDEQSGSDVEETKPTRRAEPVSSKKVVGSMQGPDSDDDSISGGSDSGGEDDDAIDDDQDSFSDREF
jgi:clusterin-associated protein 1